MSPALFESVPVLMKNDVCPAAGGGNCRFRHYIDVYVFVSLIDCFLLLLVTCFFSCLYFSLLFTYPLSSPLRIGPLRFQASCHKRRLILGLGYFTLEYFCVW